MKTYQSYLDVHKSKLTLRVGKEDLTFGVEEQFKNSREKEEVFFVDEENELEELDKLVEEEVQTR